MKTFNKAEFAASLSAVWTKIRPVLEDIAVKNALNYVTSDFINQLGTAIQEISNKCEQKSDKDVIDEVDTIAKRLAIVFADYLGGKKVYILDGMRGGTLFNNFFPGMSTPGRHWVGISGFPESYEEFDWPEFAISKMEDAIAMARASGGKISFQVGMSTFEALAEYYPNFIATLKQAWADNVLEIVDGAYADIYDLLLGAEANVRAYQLGIATAEKLFGRRPVVLARQEIGWHPQLPQILHQAGYKGVVLRTRLQGSVPTFQCSMMLWRGFDGTKIPCLPTTEGIPTGDYIGGVFYNQVLRDIEAAKKVQGDALILTNLENLTDPIEGRREFYLATARGRTIGPFLTHSEFFASAGTPSTEQEIPRDRLHVPWECQASGERWKRAQIYNLLKPTESALLMLESMATLDYLFRKQTTPENFDQHQYLWKTYLQAATFNSFKGFDHVTGSNFKVRVKDLGPYQGPMAGISIGEKAAQCYNKVLEECNLRIQAFTQQIAANIPTNPAVGKDEDPNVVGNVLVLNPLFTDRPQKFEVTIPRTDIFLEGPSGIPIQQVTISGTILVEDSLPPFGGVLYSIKKGSPTKSPRIVNLQWTSANRMAESDAYQIQFDEEGQITQIYDRILRTSLLLNRTVSLFAHKKPTLKVLENGPIRMILEIRGKAATTRLTLYNRDRTICFETEVAKDPIYVRWWPQGEQLKAHADFPFGLEETRRENLTGLNFALVSGKGPVVYQFGNAGMQNYFFLPSDVSDKELDKKINSRAPRAGDLRLVVVPLAQKHTHHYFLNIAPQPFTPAAVLLTSLLTTLQPRCVHIKTLLKSTTFPTFKISNPSLVTTSCRVMRDRAVELRLINYSGETTECQVTLPPDVFHKNAEVVDLTGNVLQKIPIDSGIIPLNFKGWEFKTIRFA